MKHQGHKQYIDANNFFNQDKLPRYANIRTRKMVIRPVHWWFIRTMTNGKSIVTCPQQNYVFRTTYAVAIDL